jgi:hypothetical protein
MEETMAFIDPNRPEIDPAQPLLPLHNPTSAFDDGPRGNDLRENRARNSGLMLAGVIIIALMIAGLVNFSGKVEIGDATKTPPATTSQPTAQAPAGAPTTTGQAPAR